jgi:hypothetical protein
VTDERDGFQPLEVVQAEAAECDVGGWDWERRSDVNGIRSSAHARQPFRLQRLTGRLLRRGGAGQNPCVPSAAAAGSRIGAPATFADEGANARARGRPPCRVEPPTRPLLSGRSVSSLRRCHSWAGSHAAWALHRGCSRITSVSSHAWGKLPVPTSRSVVGHTHGLRAPCAIDTTSQSHPLARRRSPPPTALAYAKCRHGNDRTPSSQPDAGPEGLGLLVASEVEQGVSSFHHVSPHPELSGASPSGKLSLAQTSRQLWVEPQVIMERYQGLSASKVSFSSLGRGFNDQVLGDGALSLGHDPESQVTPRPASSDAAADGPPIQRSTPRRSGKTPDPDQERQPARSSPRQHPLGSAEGAPRGGQQTGREARICPRSWEPSPESAIGSARCERIRGLPRRPTLELAGRTGSGRRRRHHVEAT